LVLSLHSVATFGKYARDDVDEHVHNDWPVAHTYYVVAFEPAVQGFCYDVATGSAKRQTVIFAEIVHIMAH
jgi:hypothetical protein